MRAFELAFPERFLECGIAEQDMVSTAAGLARHGLLPVVNSFASFLASRANEQIYNQASEGSKVVYALHYAGLIPAGPGKSHQSVRDVSLLGALPGDDDRAARERGGDARAPALGGRRGDSERRDPACDRSVTATDRAARATSSPAAGTLLREGADAVLLAYGPVMLHEALTASELLEREDVGLAVREHAVAESRRRRLARATRSARYEHALRPRGSLAGRRPRRRAAPRAARWREIVAFGVEGWPACGTPSEALRAHELDGRSLAARIAARIGARAPR